MTTTTQLKVQLRSNGKVVREASFQEFPVLFGRSSTCNFQILESSYVSRVHGSISLDKNEIVITDLGSANGFFIGNVNLRTARSKGQLSIRIGDIEMNLFLEGEEQEDEEVTNISVFRPASVPLEALQADPSEPRTTYQTKPTASVNSFSPTRAQKLPERPVAPSKEKAPPATDLSPLEFAVAPTPGIERMPFGTLSLQGVMTWDEDIYDVRNFAIGDDLIVGGNEDEPIALPTTTQKLVFGQFVEQGAHILILPRSEWRLTRNKSVVSEERLSQENRFVRDQNGRYYLRLERNEVMSFNLGSGLALHFRFVKKPQFYMPRTWIENREEFKKAILVSSLVHALICIIAVLIAPRSEAPKIANVPPRIAKLLVEPPNQILAAKPEPPKPTPPPEVPTPTPAPLPPPPKVVAAKPKLPPRQKPLPAKTVAKTPPSRAKPSPGPTSPAPVAKRPPAPASPPSPSREELEQQQLANMLGALPGPPKPNTRAGAPIQVSKGQISSSGVKVAGVTQAAVQTIEANRGTGAAGGDFKVGGGGKSYSTKGQAGGAGARGVKGAVVGAPNLAANVGSEQGLSNEQVMLIVNKHLGEVQR